VLDGSLADGGDAETCPGPAGTLDPSFGDGGMLLLKSDGGTSSFAVAVQPDGRILLGVDRTNGAQKFGVLRLRSDGAVDPTFGTAGVAETVLGTSDQNLRALQLQPDGKVLAAGSSRNVGKDSDFALVRYLPTGALDTTFGSSGIVLTDFGGQFDVGRAITLMPDGRIMVAGSTVSNDGTTGDMAVARYQADGALDSTFGTGGRLTVDIRGTVDQARAIAPVAGGRFLLAGTTRDPNGSRIDIAAARVDTAGNLDTSFGVAGKFVGASGGSGSQVINALAVGPSGTAFLVGTNPPDFGVFSLTSSGAPNASFGTSGTSTVDFDGRNDESLAVAQQGDGQLVLVGTSIAPTGVDSRVAISRMTPSGALDVSFGSGGKTVTALPQGHAGSSLAAGVALDRCSVVTVGGWLEVARGVSNIGVVRYRR
jgi:uncharacterized delta-60 repeat protein